MISTSLVHDSSLLHSNLWQAYQLVFRQRSGKQVGESNDLEVIKEASGIAKSKVDRPIIVSATNSQVQPYVVENQKLKRELFFDLYIIQKIKITCFSSHVTGVSLQYSSSCINSFERHDIYECFNRGDVHVRILWLELFVYWHRLIREMCSLILLLAASLLRIDKIRDNCQYAKYNISDKISLLPGP